MDLDIERLKTIINEMGFEVEFNSKTPGFQNPDNSIIEFDKVIFDLFEEKQ